MNKHTQDLIKKALLEWSTETMDPDLLDRILLQNPDDYEVFNCTAAPSGLSVHITIEKIGYNRVHGLRCSADFRDQIMSQIRNQIT